MNKKNLNSPLKSSLQSLKNAQRHSERMKSNKQNNNAHIKRLVVTIGVAAAIGLLLGLIMLNVFTQIDKNGEKYSLSASKIEESKKKNNKEVATGHELTTLHAYVIQAGVFTEQDNINEWESFYKEAGFLPVIWKRDEMYYLFVSLASSENAAKEIAENMGKQGFDVYVKEWQTASREVAIGEDDLRWLEKFHTLWQTSVKDGDNKSEQLLNDWHNLIQVKNIQADSIVKFEQEIAHLISQFEKGDRDFQSVLLAIWNEYDQLLQ